MFEWDVILIRDVHTPRILSTRDGDKYSKVNCLADVSNVAIPLVYDLSAVPTDTA